MHDAFKTSLENTIKKKMTQDQFVSYLVHSEWDNRKNVERAVRVAQFRYNTTLDDVDYTFEPDLDRNRRSKRGQRPLAGYASQEGGKRS